MIRAIFHRDTVISVSYQTRRHHADTKIIILHGDSIKMQLEEIELAVVLVAE